MSKVTFQSSTPATAAAATSVNIAYPASIAAGDLLLLWVARDSTLTEPAGWSNIGASNSAGNVLVELHAAVAIGTETGNLALSFTTGNIVAVLQRWAGPVGGGITNLVAGIAANTSGAGTTLTPSTQSGVPANGVTAACGGAGLLTGTATASIAGTNWTQDQNVSLTGKYALSTSRNVTDTGTVTGPTITFSQSDAGHAGLSVQLIYVPVSGALFFGSL